MESFDEIISKIVAQTGTDRQEIVKRVRDKQRELSNIISEEGAAYLIAKEAGIELIKKKDYEVKIGSIIAGMKNVNTTGRLISAGEVKPFKTEKAEGKLCSIMIGDETGVIRLVLWNEQADKVEDLRIGSLVKIINAYSRDNMGHVELNLGKSGRIEKTQDLPTIPDVTEIEAKFVFANRTYGKTYEPLKISRLTEGKNARLRACVAQVFEGNPIFYTCPECGIKVQGNCAVHGKKEPNLVISGIADDGTGNIRIVMFRSAAERLLGMSTAEAESILETTRNANEIYKKIQLGKDYIFKGFAKKNKLFERLEFVVNEVDEVNPREEIQMILGK